MPDSFADKVAGTDYFGIVDLNTPLTVATGRAEACGEARKYLDLRRRRVMPQKPAQAR